MLLTFSNGHYIVSGYGIERPRFFRSYSDARHFMHQIERETLNLK